MTRVSVVKTALKHLLYQVSTRLAVETKIVNLQRFHASGLVSTKVDLLRICSQGGHARTTVIVSSMQFCLSCTYYDFYFTYWSDRILTRKNGSGD